MRRLVLMTAAIALLGCGSTLAQQMRVTPTRNAPASRTTSSAAGLTPPPVTVPGTIPTPGASALGAIQLVPGTAASISAGAAGSITACPSTGIGAPAPSAIDASNAVGMTGVLSPQPLPG